MSGYTSDRDPADPPSTKSGASRRRGKREAEEAAAPSADDDGAWSRDFAEAGSPDLADAGCDLDYVRRLQLICLRQMATTPFPTPAQRNCWQRVREMSAVVGMTSNRSKLEAKVRKLEGALRGRRDAAGSVDVRPSSAVKRPPTARGQLTAPRALPPDGEAPQE